MITVVIDEELIKDCERERDSNPDYYCCEQCGLARAISKARGKASSVGSRHWFSEAHNERGRVYGCLPEEAKTWMRLFDAKELLKPITFEIEELTYND